MALAARPDMADSIMQIWMFWRLNSPDGGAGPAIARMLSLPRPGRAGMAAVRIRLLALLSEQVLELIAGQAGFKVGLVFTPGLTGLQDSPGGCPAKRSLPVQAHMLGDGSGSLQDRGRGGWQAAKKSASAHGSPMQGIGSMAT